MRILRIRSNMFSAATVLKNVDVEIPIFIYCNYTTLAQKRQANKQGRIKIEKHAIMRLSP